MVPCRVRGCSKLLTCTFADTSSTIGSLDTRKTYCTSGRRQLRRRRQAKDKPSIRTDRLRHSCDGLGKLKALRKGALQHSLRESSSKVSVVELLLLAHVLLHNSYYSLRGLLQPAEQHVAMAVCGKLKHHLKHNLKHHHPTGRCG